MTKSERFYDRYSNGNPEYKSVRIYNDPLSREEKTFFDQTISLAEEYVALDQEGFAILFEGGIVAGNRVAGTQSKPTPTWIFDVKHGTFEKPERTHLFVGYRQTIDRNNKIKDVPLLLIAGNGSLDADGQPVCWNVFTNTPENIQVIQTVVTALETANSMIQNG